VSDNEPNIVLNEFGDLSRKARRELEAQGIDPDTAVMEFKLATGQIATITPEEAAAAKAQAQAEAAASHTSPYVPTPEPVTPTPVPETPAATALAEKSEVAPQTAAIFPAVSEPVTQSQTGPVAPVASEPTLDSDALAQVERTLADVSEHTGEVLSPFDKVIASTASSSSPEFADQSEPKLSRKEKKALLKAEKKREKENEKGEAREAAAAASLVVASVPELIGPAPAAEPTPQQESPEAIVNESTVEVLEVDVDSVEEIHEDSVVFEVDDSLTVVYEDEEDAPQTIAEATAAIAIAEAVAAAEAVVEAGEMATDYQTSSSVPTTTGSIPVISNALILPSLPEDTGSIAPVVPTGEIVITGSILIPPSISQVGAHVDSLDTSDIDIIDDGAEQPATSTLSPVSAASAVSAYNIANAVVTTPRGMNERLPFILSIAAAGLAVGVVALFVTGYILGIF
jgi:hypothetical protein